ncbi:MAG: DNA pilot protein [Microviridae sp.]|nr:MAG: DNA pilot protein [Microviridae sp.]
MGIWSKIGKGLKKVLKVAAPIAAVAAPFIPGVGSAISGVIGKVGGMFGGGSSAASNAPPAFVGPPDPANPTEGQSVSVTAKRDPDPGFDWKGAIGAVAPIATGALNYIGQQNTNVANAEQAQKQMDFQASQTSTSYQRGVADMKAAGLNPMLAYSQGGAASGSGAQASMGNALGAGANSAQSAYLARQQMAQSDAQIGNINADTDLKSSTEDLQKQQRLESVSRTTNLGTQNEKLLKDIIGQDLQNTLAEGQMQALIQRASSAADLTRAEASSKKYGLTSDRIESEWQSKHGTTYRNASRALEVANSAKSLVNPLAGIFKGK